MTTQRTVTLYEDDGRPVRVEITVEGRTAAARVLDDDPPGLSQPPSPADLAAWARAAKAALARKARPETVRARWASCEACERHDAGLCAACHCAAGLKIRVARARCPIGRWGAEPAE